MELDRVTISGLREVWEFLLCIYLVGSEMFSHGFSLESVEQCKF